MRETNMVRIGIVSSTNPKDATVTVTFPDIDNMVTTDLPVIFPQGLKNKAYAMPDVGENILCIFIEQGRGDGFCIGSFYTPDCPPPISNQNKVHYAFCDGTFIEYDRETHKLTVDINGELDIISAKNVRIQAAKEVNVECENLSGNFKTGDISGENLVVSSKALTATCSTGNISGDNLNISGGTVCINGEVTIGGNILLTGNVSIEGNVNCPGYCKC